MRGRDKKPAGGRLMVIFPPPLLPLLHPHMSQFMTSEAPSQDFNFNTQLMTEQTNVLQAAVVYNK